MDMDASTGPTTPSPDRLRALSERIGRDHDCRLVVLFGSAARDARRDFTDYVAAVERFLSEQGP